MTPERVVRVSRDIGATPEAVFRALTHPLELAYWFCHQAWSEPQVGSDLWVRWRNGWWARGVYQTVERPRRVVLSWQGRDEPGETAVTFELDAVERGTTVTVIHSGYGADRVWNKAVAEAEKSWPLALDNLASVLTTGVDLREANRPMLGIVPDELTVDRAIKEGIATERGIYLASVIDQGGAAEAGLQKGDVIVSIGGLAVTDWNSLSTTLTRYRAGDRVQVRYVRGPDHGMVDLELKPRPQPELAFDPQQMVAQARAEWGAVLAEFRQALTGLSEAQAERKPAPDEWSVKETLVHLSLSERWAQRWYGDVIAGTTSGQTGDSLNEVPELFAMVLAVAPTVEALLARWEREMEETLALVAALRPEVVALKARYRQLASSLYFWPFHARDHLDQIKATIAALRD